MDDLETGTVDLDPAAAHPSAPARVLTVLWSAEEPGRVGERVAVGRRSVLGRGAARHDDPAPRVFPYRARPGRSVPTEPFGARALSRVQLVLEPDGDGLRVSRAGRAGLRVGGREVDDGRAMPGDLVEIAGVLLFRYDRQLGPPDVALPDVPFGRADDAGLVGESDAIWALRERAARVGARDVHVLVHGPTGAGKELVARALHLRSARARGPFVARNAATLPDTLIDAELFGHARGYPNAGMPERAGLIGEAHGGTLFLDEVGELPPELQAHLLRVLDRGGEYQRLGDPRPRRSDLRLVAATNRDPGELRFDFGARLPIRVDVPGLDARAEDVPLLVRHLFARMGAPDAEKDRFRGADGDPVLTSALVAALVAHRWQQHVRELEAALWVAIDTSPGRALDLTPALAERLGPADIDPLEVAPEAIAAALAAHKGSVTRAARELGLSSRYVLYRLMRRYGIEG